MVTAMSRLPGELRGKEKGVKNEANDVVHGAYRGKGAVAALVGNYP